MRAFNGCKSSIAFASGMTAIPSYALEDSSTKHITIPSSVTSISESAFVGCGALVDITFEGTKEQWDNITKNSNWNTGTGTITVICTDGNLTVSEE